MDETFQDSVVSSSPNTARDGGAWLDPITIPADGPDPLAGNTRDFLSTAARNPTEHAEAFWQWIQAHIEHTGCAPGKAHPMAPKPTTTLRDRSGRTLSGINFSALDYFSLASHDPTERPYPD